MMPCAALDILYGQPHIVVMTISLVPDLPRISVVRGFMGAGRVVTFGRVIRSSRMFVTYQTPEGRIVKRALGVGLWIESVPE